MPKDNADMLWVCAGGGSPGGTGTYEDPFRSIKTALSYVRPGQTIVLKSGRYYGDLTLQCCGSIDHAIYITSDERREVYFESSSWFLYDVSDIVITHIAFVHCQRNALSVIGACQRNRFVHLRFIGCGRDGETSCAIFMGGWGGACNVVEDCVFERPSPPSPPGVGGKGACVGVMAAQGGEGNDRTRNCIFRRNRFINYTYGILVGSGNVNAPECGHIVEENIIDNCLLDGIVVSCGDTTVRNNMVRNCRRSAIAVTSGRGSTVEDNRVLDCGNGVMAAGIGHTVRNNCIVRCPQSAVHINAQREPLEKPLLSRNIIVEANTCVDCGIDAANVVVDGDATCVIRRNLFHGPGEAYRFASETASNRRGRMVSDNILHGKGQALEGTIAKSVVFAGKSVDNYDNDSGFGAQGWMVRSNVYEIQPIDKEEAKAYSLALGEETDNMTEMLIRELNDEEIARRSMLLEEEENS